MTEEKRQYRLTVIVEVEGVLRCTRTREYTGPKASVGRLGDDAFACANQALVSGYNLQAPALSVRRMTRTHPAALAAGPIPAGEYLCGPVREVKPGCPVCKGTGQTCTYCGAPRGECIAPNDFLHSGFERCAQCGGEG